MSKVLMQILERFWDAESQLKALEGYYKQLGLI